MDHTSSRPALFSISAIVPHLRAIVADLREYEIPEKYAGLFNASLSAVLEACIALDAYFQAPNGDRLNRELIGTLLDFTQRWENWLAAVKFQSAESAVFHSMLLRFSKGISKAYRCWRIDLLKTPMT